MLLTTILTGVGLSQMNKDAQPEAKVKKIRARFKIAEGPLVTKTYKKLGISISLPKDVLDVTVWSQNQYQRDTGSKMLEFKLAVFEPPMFSGLEISTIWIGYVNVFTSEQLRDWNASGYELPAWTNIKGEAAKSESFDLIQTQTKPEQRVGYDQKNFRIDRKAKDGRVLMATINRCEYTIQTGARERDLLMITNILQSVKFLEP